MDAQRQLSEKRNWACIISGPQNLGLNLQNKTGLELYALGWGGPSTILAAESSSSKTKHLLSSSFFCARLTTLPPETAELRNQLTMSTSGPSDSVMAMLIDGEDEPEVHELQTDVRTLRGISPSLSSNYGGDGDEGRRKKVLALSDTDGLFCPICMEAWESQGDHQVRLEIQVSSWFSRNFFFPGKLIGLCWHAC